MTLRRKKIRLHLVSLFSVLIRKRVSKANDSYTIKLININKLTSKNMQNINERANIVALVSDRKHLSIDNNTFVICTYTEYNKQINSIHRKKR